MTFLLPFYCLLPTWSWENEDAMEHLFKSYLLFLTIFTVWVIPGLSPLLISGEYLPFKVYPRYKLAFYFLTATQTQNKQWLVILVSVVINDNLKH